MLLGLALASTSAPLQLFSLPQENRSALDRQFQQAMDAQDRGDLHAAKAMLLALRRDHPGNFAIDESLGMIFVAQGDFAGGLPFLHAAVREQPSSDIANANLGAALYRLHRNQQALAAFQRAATLNPANASTQQSLGELWMAAGKPHRAAQAFAAALQLNKGDAALTVEYASALLAADDLDTAHRILTALPSNDASADCQKLLGDIDERGGNYRSAVEHYNRAATLDSSEANVWTLGVEFLRHWTFDAAIREFEAAVIKFPTSTRMKLGLATAYFGGAKYAQAIPVFSQLLQADGNNHLYAEMLGMACTAVSSSGKQDCSALIRYAQAHPRDAKAATSAASMLLTESSNDTQSSLGRKLLAQAIAADPKLPDAQYLMGVVKQNQGDWAGSIANLQTALALKPELAQAHYRLALAYHRTGRMQEARTQIALQKQYSQQQQQDLDRRLRQITTFVIDEKD